MQRYAPSERAGVCEAVGGGLLPKVRPSGGASVIDAALLRLHRVGSRTACHLLLTLILIILLHLHRPPRPHRGLLDDEQETGAGAGSREGGGLG